MSVLFADLVGFTPLSERLDAEEVRDVLSRYFDSCRRIVDRYGGTIEKFIGDAVMAVWGSPVAREDDAERAVRAALELVAAVAALGADLGETDLRARAGVLTGEASVTPSAQHEGMVVGDLVNTASRLQSIAPPGSVVVGDATRRATEASIAYEDHGLHELKGKAEPMQAWRAVHVTAGRKGFLKAAGLEAPFVGRDREIRLLKDLFHATAEEGRAHLVSVIGFAGIGKSRLSWEFEKYVDGLLDTIFWHRGRCLSYGEGVTYWALAEMVKRRAGIAEEEEPASAAEKLHASVVTLVPDPDEQRWIEPRLAHLLGLEERTSTDREDLFAGWRLFFERMSAVHPVAMVFEDVQWADASMLDFITYLLDWSKDHPVFVVTLARPEFVERRPGWGTGRRGFTQLFLEPLGRDAMDALLRGLVPGLPEDLRDQIRERAEGVPLYAVETVRMLLDRGLLERVGERYQPVSAITSLDVPETLHALVAARLDGLEPRQRRLLQTAAVLGKTFTLEALVALDGGPDEEIAAALAALTRKEFLAVQQDPRSPEHGQYGFVQAMMKTVAYDTLSKKDRKVLHLAAARYLEDAWTIDPDEVVEVLASHYLDAHACATDAPDADEIKMKAKDRLVRAGQRAASLAAAEEAQRYFERAADLSGDELEKAGLYERAGNMASLVGHQQETMELLERAHEIFEQQGASHPAARVSARIGENMWLAGNIEEALDRLDKAFLVLHNDVPDTDLAELAHSIGRLRFFTGDLDEAAQKVDLALQIAEPLQAYEIISQALNTKSLLAEKNGRYQESIALQRHALTVALENDLPQAAMRAHFNLAYTYHLHGNVTLAAETDERGLALAHRIGSPPWEWSFTGHLAFDRYLRGEWDDVETRSLTVPRPDQVAAARFAWGTILIPLSLVRIARGDLEGAWDVLRYYEGSERSADLQESANYAAPLAVYRLAEGRLDEALRLGSQAWDSHTWNRASNSVCIIGFIGAAEAALGLGRPEVVETMIATVRALPAPERGSFLTAHADRYAARIDAGRGQLDESGFVAAETLFREIGFPFWLAQTLVDHATCLEDAGRAEDAAPLLAEAREIFVKLDAKLWLERVGRASEIPG